MLVKNLPPVSVSAGFQDRLRARLADEDANPVAAPQPRVSQAGGLKWAVAAGLLIIVAGGITTLPSNDADAPARLPAVFATVPDVASGDDSTPAYMASMSTGIPMWPALMLAEEGPLRFAAAGFQPTGWDGARPN